MIRVRWDAIVTLIVAVAVAFLMGVTAATNMMNAADPYHGAPRCTDAIADARGICWGEPLPGSEPISH